MNQTELLAMPHKCGIKGCTNAGTEIRDYSIQLPDYRWFCKEHVGEEDRKQTAQFEANLAKGRRAEEDRLLAEADAIRARRALPAAQ